MAYWILKVARQSLYPDVFGERYVFDNTHSVRVEAGDVFLYLDKTTEYSFTGTGLIRRVSSRQPSLQEAERSNRVRIVFTAHLADVIRFRRHRCLSR
jgi:hypothetical protein